MTAEIQIRPLDELTIEPEALCPIEEITRARAEEERRGREFWCYTVPSDSEPLNPRTVVYNSRTQQIYCDCPAGRNERKCRHVKSVLFLHIYNETFRLYHACTLPELQERERDFIEMGRATKIPIRGWQAMQGAIGELIRERTETRAA